MAEIFHIAGINTISLPFNNALRDGLRALTKKIPTGDTHKCNVLQQ